MIFFIPIFDTIFHILAHFISVMTNVLPFYQNITSQTCNRLSIIISVSKEITQPLIMRLKFYFNFNNYLSYNSTLFTHLSTFLEEKLNASLCIFPNLSSYFTNFQFLPTYALLKKEERKNTNSASQHFALSLSLFA